MVGGALAEGALVGGAPVAGGTLVVGVPFGANVPSLAAVGNAVEGLLMSGVVGSTTGSPTGDAEPS